MPSDFDLAIEFYTRAIEFPAADEGKPRASRTRECRGGFCPENPVAIVSQRETEWIGQCCKLVARALLAATCFRITPISHGNLNGIAGT